MCRRHWPLQIFELIVMSETANDDKKAFFIQAHHV